MTDDTTHDQMKPYCDMKEALEWIAFGWPAFENRADRIPFENKQRFDGKTFRFAEKQLKQAVLNRNLPVTGIPYSRGRFPPSRSFFTSSLMPSSPCRSGFCSNGSDTRFI